MVQYPRHAIIELNEDWTVKSYSCLLCGHTSSTEKLLVEHLSAHEVKNTVTSVFTSGYFADEAEISYTASYTIEDIEGAKTFPEPSDSKEEKVNMANVYHGIKQETVMLLAADATHTIEGTRYETSQEDENTIAMPEAVEMDESSEPLKMPDGMEEEVQIVIIKQEGGDEVEIKTTESATPIRTGEMLELDSLLALTPQTKANLQYFSDATLAIGCEMDIGTSDTGNDKQDADVNEVIEYEVVGIVDRSDDVDDRRVIAVQHMVSQDMEYTPELPEQMLSESSGREEKPSISSLKRHHERSPRKKGYSGKVVGTVVESPPPKPAMQRPKRKRSGLLMKKSLEDLKGMKRKGSKKKRHVSPEPTSPVRKGKGKGKFTPTGAGVSHSDTELSAETIALLKGLFGDKDHEQSKKAKKRSRKSIGRKTAEQAMKSSKKKPLPTKYSYSYKQNEDGKWPCPICDKVLCRREVAKQHVQHMHTNDVNLVCPVCGKGFTYHSNFNVHVAQHADSHPFKCTKCGQGFTQPAHKTRHEKICGVTQATFLCEYGCEKLFKSEAYLKEHVLNVHESEGFACEHCSKVFSHRSSMYKHRKMCGHSEKMQQTRGTYLTLEEDDDDDDSDSSDSD